MTLKPICTCVGGALHGHGYGCPLYKIDVSKKFYHTSSNPKPATPSRTVRIHNTELEVPKSKFFARREGSWTFQIEPGIPLLLVTADDNVLEWLALACAVAAVEWRRIAVGIDKMSDDWDYAIINSVAWQRAFERATEQEGK